MTLVELCINFIHTHTHTHHPLHTHTHTHTHTTHAFYTDILLDSVNEPSDDKCVPTLTKEDFFLAKLSQSLTILPHKPHRSSASETTTHQFNCYFCTFSFSNSRSALLGRAHKHIWTETKLEFGSTDILKWSYNNYSVAMATGVTITKNSSLSTVVFPFL